MKKDFLLLCAALLALGSLLPLVGYKLVLAFLSQALPSGVASSAAALPAASSGSPNFGVLFAPPSAAAEPTSDADMFYIFDEDSGQVQQVARLDYIIGAVAAEMPVSWPDEALKAQAIAAHSYALYCRDNSMQENGAWLSASPAKRQGYLTDSVLHSYWGTDYEANYARLSVIVDEVLTKVLYYGDSPACASYFAISNGSTEAAANVWGADVPYLTPVDSSLDKNAVNYTYTAIFSAEQVHQALAQGLGITADASRPHQWFGEAEHTAAGYVGSISVCGQTVSGAALRKALSLRSTCFEISFADNNFYITTRGYGHGVGLSQWGAKALAERGQSYAEILAHYFPGTELRG